MTEAKRLMQFGESENIIVSDTFTRADNSTSLGAAETGQIWTKAVLGTSGDFGIISNKAYISSIVSASTIYNFVDSGFSEIETSVNLTYYSYGAICLRYVDASNNVRLRLSSTGISLIKSVSGTSTIVTSYAMTPVSGTTYNLKISANGTTIKCYLNNVLVIESTVTNFTTATKTGIMYFSNTTTSSVSDRFDNFKVVKI